MTAWEEAQKQAHEAQSSAWEIAEEDRELREMGTVRFFDIDVSAHELKIGDSIYDRNGFGYCSTTVLGIDVNNNGEIVYVHTRLGDRKYYAEETVQICRDTHHH